MRVFLTALVVMLAALPATAQSFIEAEVDGAVSAKLFYGKSLSEEDGLFAYVQAQPKWAQFYGGFFVKPASWIKFSMGFGMEKNRHPLRFGMLVSGEKEPFATLLVYEEGGSGKWYKYTAITGLGGIVNLGVLSQTKLGTGPLLEINLPHRFTLGAALTRYNGEFKSLIGLTKGI